MSEIPGQSAKVKTFPWQLAIPLAPVLGYLYAYQYEAGYHKAFGIPSELITVDQTSFFLWAGASLIVLYFLAPLLILWYIYQSEIKGPIASALMNLALPALYFLTLMIIWGPYWREWVWSAILMLVFAVGFYAYQISGQYDKKGISAKLSASWENAPNTPFGRWLNRNLTYPAFILLLLGLWGITISNDIGEAEALQKREFAVLTDTPNTVILRKHGDTIICASFDRDAKKLTGQCFIIKVADGSSVAFTYEEVGPLKKPK